MFFQLLKWFIEPLNVNHWNVWYIALYNIHVVNSKTIDSYWPIRARTASIIIVKKTANPAFLFPGWSPRVTNGLMVVIAAASVLALVGVIHVMRVMKRSRGYKVVNQSWTIKHLLNQSMQKKDFFMFCVLLSRDVFSKWSCFLKQYKLSKLCFFHLCKMSGIFRNACTFSNRRRKHYF